MSRIPSSMASRILSRARLHRVANPHSRKIKLRLDPLEVRAMPGDMIGPLAAMTSAFGYEAMRADVKLPERPPTDEAKVTPRPAPEVSSLAEAKQRRDAEVNQQRRIDPAESAPARTPAIDLGDLSFPNEDSTGKNLLPNPAQNTGGSGGGGGAGDSSRPSSAGVAQSAVPASASFDPSTRTEESISASVPINPVASAPTSPVPVPLNSGAVSGAIALSPAERLVAEYLSPPQDKAPLEPAGPSAKGPNAPATTTDPIYAVGTDAGTVGRLRVFDAQTNQREFTRTPFGSGFRGGVRVAVADVTGDGTADIIAAQGQNGANRVRVYDGVTRRPVSGTLSNFVAFGTSQSDGVYVAAGDVNGDGHADIIVGTDGGASDVRIFSGANGQLLRSLDLGDLPITNGARVAAGDVNGDGLADVVVGSIPGDVSIVGVYDGGNGMELYEYQPFRGDDRGGVNLAVGDVTGDRYADVIVGQASGGSQVKVFSGNDTASSWNLPTLENFTSAARVGAVDANMDGKLDVLVGEGPGSGGVRIYSMNAEGDFDQSKPFGSAFKKGVFVAGDSRPAEGEEFDENSSSRIPTPLITFGAITPAMEGGTATVVFNRTGSTTPTLGITLTLGGTAVLDTDYTASSVSFGSGSSTASLVLTLTQDSIFEGLETIVVTVDSVPFTYDANISTVVPLPDLDISLITPVSEECGCDATEVAPQGEGVANPIGPVESSSNIRMADGTVVVSGTDLMSSGMGQGAAIERNWTNAVGYDASGYDGNNIVLGNLPYVRTDGTDVIAVTDGNVSEYFDGSGGSFTPRDYSQDSLVLDSMSHEFSLVTTSGAKIVFNDFDVSLPAAQRGQVKTVTDPKGNVTTVTSVDGSGRPLEVQRTSTTGGTTTTESYLYAYISGGTNDGKIESVTLRRQVGMGSWTTVRKSEYSYHDGMGSTGTAGDLKTAIVKDASTNTLENSYYRYYTSVSSTGYEGALKFSVTGDSYERFLEWCDNNTTTPDDATDMEVAVFADHYFEYDSIRRVTKHVQQGTGCSSCAGGLGEETYSYTTSPFADGYNSWRTKTVETRADGNTMTYFTNVYGQPILEVFEDTTTNDEWMSYYRYDSVGRLILTAAPSAISGYDESTADLLNNQSGDYQYLRNGEGLISTQSFYSSTTAGSSTAGGVDGYRYQSHIQRGETGTAILQGTTEYFSRTDGSITIYPVANVTQYRNTNGTGDQTTSYAYSWFSGTIQPESVTTTLPVVTTDQNGSNSANSYVSVSDDRGRTIWSKDEAGYINYFEYDDVTGGTTKVIRDVDTTQTGTFSSLPGGWSTPGGGGLHLTTTYELDDLGRTTKETEPNGTVNYTVYKDADHEVRYYPGWDTGTDTPTGPTSVSRTDRALGYTESLTMSATPTVSSGRPTGTESISSVQSLSRSVVNDAGQVIYQDEYIDFTGTSYSQSSVTLGSAGTNYLRTEMSYDTEGRQHRTITPTGTIYRTVFDGQGRAISQWVGTDDTPTTGFWSPTNLTGTDMVKLSENEYDDGDVGDGLLTKSTQILESPYAPRVTEMSYDWRNRSIASKAGVELSESTSVNRPISYTEYDNLSQAIVSEMYDGDGLSITTDGNSDGVPDRPSSSALRAKSTADYDELGRVYKSSTFSVDPTSGSVSTNSLVSQQWYNSRGMVMKSSSPGGTVSKSEFDGVGRTTKSYVTNGGGDTGYGDADDVTGDNVLSQTEMTYDANSNLLMSISRERFHDETGTGSLGTPSTGVLARVSYSANYYDLASRITDTVNVGTNGGSSYSRPGSVPSRSDTVLVNSYGYDAAGRVDTTTDPMGLINKTEFDLAGRTTKTIENYVDGTVSDADDKTVDYTYHTNGQMKTLKAYLTSSTYETTEWILGITGPMVSNDMLLEMRYPDSSTGNSSSGEKDQYTYNQLGQVLTKTDRNGNVHTYSYDILGRQTVDAVTTLGSGVDGAVRRIETEYDTQGNAYLLASYDAATGGSIVNQIQREFDGLGQMTTEWQAVGGAVNTSTSPKVQYAYSFAPSGSTNHSRLTSITYPNGRVITYNYASGLNADISRLSSISDGGTTLESYEYLGYGTVVKRGHAEPGVDLTFIKQGMESNGDAGDPYNGLDRFGRNVDLRWRDSSTDLERRQYGYDRDSNRLYFENMVDSTRSELYSYDGFNQLSSMERGTLNGGKTAISGSPSRSQAWDYDGLGNMDSVTTDGGGAVTRTHNKQNEITGISGASAPTYDANGNMLTDEAGKQFVFDGWNRLKVVKSSGGSTLATYSYDATGRRVREVRSGTTTDLYYSSQWQVLEERVSGSAVKSYVWSPVYVDAMIARDRDTDANGSLDERLYAVHDANFNVVALLDTSGAVVERFAYDAFGPFSVLTPAWGARGSSSYGWNYLHQGGRWDADGTIYSFRYREYSPTLGRWLQVDPIGFDSSDVNLYRVEQNSVVLYVDPMGLEKWIVDHTAQTVTLDVDVAFKSLGQILPAPVNGITKKWFDQIQYVFDHSDVILLSNKKGCPPYKPKLIARPSNNAGADLVLDVGGPAAIAAGTNDQSTAIRIMSTDKAGNVTDVTLYYFPIAARFIREYLKLEPSADDPRGAVMGQRYDGTMKPSFVSAGSIMIPRYYKQWEDRLNNSKGRKGGEYKASISLGSTTQFLLEMLKQAENKINPLGR